MALITGSAFRHEGVPIPEEITSGSEFTVMLMEGPGYLTLERKRDPNGFYTFPSSFASHSSSNMVSSVFSPYIIGSYMGPHKSGSLTFTAAHDIDPDTVYVKVASTVENIQVEMDGGIDLDSFIIQVQTDNAGTSADNQFTLPWGGTYDVDWGDGNVDTGVVDAQTHTYASAGTYDISVTATSGRINFNNGGDKAKLLDIKQWGTCAWTSFRKSFQGCSNMVSTAADNPNLSNVSDFYRSFHSCSSFNADIGSWDMSNVTNIYQMFLSCTIFNQDISSWNVSSVNTMAYLFYSARNFNQPIGNWDISNVTDLNNVFFLATSFNQPLNNWNVSNVTNMQNMFRDAAIFNQPLDTWDVSNVTNMGAMFYRCYGFDQDISNWQVSQVTNFTDFMLNITLSTANYDALLIAWDAQGAMNYSGTVNFGSSTYTLGGAAEAARTSLISKWGGIVDGGGVVNPFTTNLLASYNFDSDLSDYNGNYDGTTSGTITHSPFKVNDGGYFSGGNSDFVTLPNTNDAFTFHDGSGNDIPFSVSFWVEESGFAGSSGGIVGNCFWNNLKTGIKCGNDTSIQATQYSTSAWIKTSDAGSSYRGIVVKQLAFGLFLYNNELAVYDWNASAIISTGVSLNDDNWHHVVFTFSSGVTNGAQIYIDGVATGSAFTYTINSQSSELTIGIGATSGTLQNFNGKIDEVHIWTNRILTASEVQNIYNTENVGNTILPSFSTNLAASYNFDSDLTDYTGVNNGTIISNKQGSTYFFVGNNLYSRQMDIISLINNNTIDFNIFDVSTNNRISYTVSYTPDGEIKHIVATYDGSKTVSGLKFYINGIEQGNLAVEVGTYTGMNSATQQTTNVGTIPSNTNYIFSGLIDELHVYKDRELSAAEVLEIYNTENGGTSILP